MRLLSVLRLRIRSLFERRTVESELEEEFRYHLEREIDEHVAAGMSAGDAREAALRDIGRIEQNKEECRDMRRLNIVDHIIRDFGYTIRQFRKSPGFACTSIFVLALGISAAVTIFGLVEAALLKPLPYRDQDHLVGAFESSPRNSQASLSFLDFADWRKLNTVFDSIDAYALNGGFTMSTAAGAEPVAGTRVSPGFFQTLGVTPVLGRDFLANEDERAVIISHAAWQKRFGQRADVVGQTVTLNVIPRTIIGILPREFHFAPAGRGEFWALLRANDPCEQRRGCHNLKAVARLKAGVSIEIASAGMQLIARQLQTQYPSTNGEMGGATLVPLREVIVGDVRSILLLLLASACVLLLIAAVNVVTLLLVRLDSRRHEIAVRGSLGATSARLLQQFTVEGFVLAATPGLISVLLAEWGMRTLIAFMPANKLDAMPWLRGLGSNLRTVTFAAALSLLATAIFAILPAMRILLSQRLEGLMEGARNTAGPIWRRFGAGLVVAEIALAMILMTGAGLLGKSLYMLLRVDVGMRADHLASATLQWPQARYSSDAEKIALGHRVVEAISALPGVTSAAISLTPPVGAAWGSVSFHVSGRPNSNESNEVLNRQVSANHFATLNARLIRGRYFRAAEDASQPRVAIVNQSLAKQYFAGEDPVGKQIYYDAIPGKPMEVVGIVDDIKEGPIESANLPVLYVPFDQNPVAWFAVLVRTSTSEQSLLPAIAATVHSIDRDISVPNPLTMTDQIQNSPMAYLHRSSAWLAGAFAAVALILGVIGLYGVVAHSVGRRTREIALRMALGAEPASVYQLILREVCGLVFAATILGIGGSLGAAAVMRGLYYGVRVWDISILMIVSAVLIAAALLASYIPARRAISVNPVVLLRSE